MLLSRSWLGLGLLTIAYALTTDNSTSTITWQACPEINKNISILNDNVGSAAPFDCAKLSVPLDYTDLASGSLDLDLFKVNATKEPVLGTVLINFGGPGGTGAQNLPAFATQFQRVIGEQWNLLSWDPRGTGRTIPFICNLPASPLSAITKRDDPGIVKTNLTAGFVNGGWDYVGLVAETCYQQANQTGQLISSAFVARDMMRIVDALGEDGLLRYYGWSYGTALGSIVSAMFPDRVERVLLDGNLNPHTYQTGDYGNFLVDTDEVFSGFLQGCVDNKQSCDLAQYTNANTTGDILDVLNQALLPLATNATTGVEAFLTFVAVQGFIFSDLYFPATWPTLASTITSVLNGSAASLTPTSPASSSPTVEPWDLSANSVLGIRGADATLRTDSEEEYLPIVKYGSTVSNFDTQYTSLWVSARWKIAAKEQYTGNFSVTTKHPIMYINGKFDPVTPLINAYNGSQSFVGSAVLPHGGYGHGIVADPSTCVNQYVQAYFANGTLPPSDAFCEPDQTPWAYAEAVAAAAASPSASSSGTSPSPSSYTSGASRQGINVLIVAWLLLINQLIGVL